MDKKTIRSKSPDSLLYLLTMEGGFPGGSVVKTLTANVGDVGLIPGLGRSPGGGNGNPLQYSCLGNCLAEKAGKL